MIGVIRYYDIGKQKLVVKNNKSKIYLYESYNLFQKKVDWIVESKCAVNSIYFNVCIQVP